jgi:hypothetical protein
MEAQVMSRVNSSDGIDLDTEIGFLSTPEAVAQQEVQEATKLLEESYAESTLELNTVEYDTNLKAQINMTSVGAIANWQFNLRLVDQMKRLAENPDTSVEMKQFAQIIAEAYNSLYKGVRLDWKGADNKMHDVQVESILEVLHKSMITKKDIVKKTVTS